MPVITLEHPTSPILHGKNGLIAKDMDELESHIESLLSQPDEIIRLGQGATQTVEQSFSEERFIREWNKVWITNL